MTYEAILQKRSGLLDAAGYSGKLYAPSETVPCLENKGLVARAFLYRSGAGSRLRPEAWLEWSGETGELIRSSHCWDQDFVDTARYPLDQEADYAVSAPGGAMGQVRRLRRLRSLYARLREFAFAQTLTAEQSAVAQEYAQLLSQAVAPGLRSYYGGLGRDFLRWLESAGYAVW